MYRIFKYLQRSLWLWAAVGVLFVVATVWADLQIIGMTAHIIGLIMEPGTEASAVWADGLQMLGIARIGLVASLVVGFISARIAANFARHLREKVYGKVLDFSTAEINEFSIPSLITRATNDVTQVETLIVMGFQTIIRAPIMAVWAMRRIWGHGLEWSLATLAGLGLMLLMIVVLIIFALPKFKKVQELTDNLNRVTREHLTGIRVVKAYNAKDFEAEKFEAANEELMRTNLFVQRLMTILWPMIGLIMQGLPLAIYLIGAYLIHYEELMESVELFASMMVFAQYGMQVIMAFLMMSMMFVMMPQAMVSARRITEVLEKELSLVYPEATVAESMGSAAIEFQNVSFKYPQAEDYVLEGIDFTVNPGETVAFIGATGSGKSTLLKLLTRAYDATSGRIKVQGAEVKHFTKADLNRKLGYAMQKTKLFSGTVTSNIAFGQSDFEPLQVKEAAKVAQGAEFIEKLEHAYEAPIAQGGTNVSGGQKQRLGIARTLFKKPDILIFDDSFSALDYRTDRNLRQALKSEFSKSTKLIVAQRVATIKDADKIIVLNEGKIVGMGTHEELLKTSDIYLEIATSQLTKEELGHE